MQVRNWNGKDTHSVEGKVCQAGICCACWATKMKVVPKGGALQLVGAAEGAIWGWVAVANPLWAIGKII